MVITIEDGRVGISGNEVISATDLDTLTSEELKKIFGTLTGIKRLVQNELSKYSFFVKYRLEVSLLAEAITRNADSAHAALAQSGGHKIDINYILQKQKDNLVALYPSVCIESELVRALKICKEKLGGSK